MADQLGRWYGSLYSGWCFHDDCKTGRYVVSSDGIPVYCFVDTDTAYCTDFKMDEGEIFYDDISLSSMKEEEKIHLKRRISLIFQDYQLLPELTVRENILLPCFLHEEQADQEWCDAILDRLRIREIENKYPDQLSGGQQQRTAIGRAFMTKPEYLFCDEPTGNLDRKTSESVLHLLMEVRDLCDPLIILVTHDLDIARSADIVLHIEDGMFIQD